MGVLAIHLSINLAMKLLSDIFHQEAFAAINRGGSKLRTYAIFKKTIGPETYVVKTRNTKIRKQISKLRLSNHTLMIEVGGQKMSVLPKFN